MKKLKEIINNKKVTKIEIIVSLLIFGLLFMCFLFGDIKITSGHSLSLIDLTLKGKIFDLYKVNFVDSPTPLRGITYDVPILLFFSIWNIPLYIINKIFTIDWLNSFFWLIWIKLIIVFFLAATIKVSVKICDLFKISKEDKKLLLYLFITSPIIMMVTGLFGGYDIISVFFTMLGIYYYIKNDNVKFLSFFSIAISLKMFALFIFIPLVLLKEKNLFKIFASIGVGLIVTIIGKMFGYLCPMYLESTSLFNEGMTKRLFSSQIGAGISGISIFLLVLFIVYIYCYLKKVKKNELNYYAIYIPFIIYSLFCLLVLSHPQWLILISPFMILLLIINKNKLKSNILLNLGVSVGYLLLSVSYYYWVFCTNTLKNMFINKIISKPVDEFGIQIFKNLSEFEPLFNALILSCIVVFIFINRPSKIQEEEKIESTNLEIKLLLWTRALITPLIALAIVITYLGGK